MRHVIAAAIIASANLAGAAQPHTINRAITADAEGCVASTLACGVTSAGQIAPGDCTFNDGTRYDVWRFSGSIGQVVEVTLTPIDSTLTNPVIVLIPPSGDASKTPAVGGAGTLRLSYILSSTGSWTVTVGSFDLFASGRYSIELTCAGANPAGNPQNCSTQTLSCGQTADWSVTASSCLFLNTPQAYADYDVGHFKAGDSVNVTVHSDAFDPDVSIYNTQANTPLASAGGIRTTRDASLTYYVTADDDYDVTIYGPLLNSAGEFVITEACTFAPCFSTVSIVKQPVDVHVVKGSLATFSVQATGNGPISYLWYEGQSHDTSAPLFDGQNSDFTIFNVLSKRTFWARATNGCTHADSAAATVTPTNPPHPRAVAH